MFFRKRNKQPMISIGNATGHLQITAEMIQRWNDEAKRREELLAIDFDPKSVRIKQTALNEDILHRLDDCGIHVKPIVSNLISACHDITTDEPVAYFVKQDVSDDVQFVIPSQKLVKSAAELRKAHNDDHNNLGKHGVRDDEGRVYIHGIHVANASADWTYVHHFAAYHCESDFGMLYKSALRFITPVTAAINPS